MSTNTSFNEEYNDFHCPSPSIQFETVGQSANGVRARSPGATATSQRVSPSVSAQLRAATVPQILRDEHFDTGNSAVGVSTLTIDICGVIQS